MFKKIEIEAKNQSEALKKAAEQLLIPTNKIKLEVIKEKKGILGIGAMMTFEATPNIDLAIEGKKYLDEVIAAMEINAVMEMKVIAENEILYRVQSNENALLIGKEGRTLLALQTLIRSYLSMFVTTNLMISLDIGDYHSNRKRQLEILATKTAKDVARTNIAVKLNPMNSFDRRIIHAKLSEWRDVETTSEGEGEERALIIKPKTK